MKRCTSVDDISGLYARASRVRTCRIQMATLPVQMSKYMRQSPMKLHSGRRNEAGRFFSNTKWPTQAKP